MLLLSGDGLLKFRLQDESRTLLRKREIEWDEKYDCERIAAMGYVFAPHSIQPKKPAAVGWENV